MREIPLIKKGTVLTDPKLINILNKLIEQSNEHKRVTRQVTRNLRVNAHFPRKR